MRAAGGAALNRNGPSASAGGSSPHDAPVSSLTAAIAADCEEHTDAVQSVCVRARARAQLRDALGAVDEEAALQHAPWQRVAPCCNTL